MSNNDSNDSSDNKIFTQDKISAETKITKQHHDNNKDHVFTVLHEFRCSFYILDIVKDIGPDDEPWNIDNELELVDDEPEPVQPADDNEQDIGTALEQYQVITQCLNVSQCSPSTHFELFICVCTLVEGKSCSKQFSNGYLLEARLNSMELTRKELELSLL